MAEKEETWEERRAREKKEAEIKRKKDLKVVIKLWKKEKFSKCVMNFSCGGDSMGDTNFVLYDEHEQVASNHEVTSFLEDDVYKNVDFYENSDGTYEGEAGTVTITLNENGTDFNYTKEAQGEYRYDNVEPATFVLTPSMTKFLNENVSAIEYEHWDGQIRITYKKDLVVTDEYEKLIAEMTTSLLSQMENYDFKDLGDEVEDDDSRGFRTSEELKIKGNKLKVTVRCIYTTYQDSN